MSNKEWDLISYNQSESIRKENFHTFYDYFENLENRIIVDKVNRALERATARGERDPETGEIVCRLVDFRD
jgi:hypothetical protein